MHGGESVESRHGLGQPLLEGGHGQLLAGGAADAVAGDGRRLYGVADFAQRLGDRSELQGIGAKAMKQQHRRAALN
jgi:hypothetical protein